MIEFGSTRTHLAETLNSDRRCILCLKGIPEKTKPEHILLNSLGGRMTVRNVICSDCNHQMGIGPDEDLAKTTEFLRNICQLKAGDGDNPPQIRNLETDGQRFDLVLGKPRMRASNPLEVNFTDEKIQVLIEAYSDAETDRLVTGAASKIATRLKRRAPEVIAELKRDILKGKRSGYGPAPVIQQTVQFGTGRSQQAKAKACLVLWAKVCGNAEVNSPQYDAIRNFIWTADSLVGFEDMIAMDTRALPKLPERFGSNPNLIWVGSNEAGQVFGYFRLYGAIGWRFLLRDVGAPSGKRHCLISNPFDNKEWALLDDHQCPIEQDWIWAQWDIEQLEFDQVSARLIPMLQYAHEAAETNWFRELISEGLQKAGCKEGETTTEDHIRKLAAYIAPALTAYRLKTNVRSS